jgi:TetR/AcrR family transcriptional regulator, transcriptional repressor for nem operon
MNSEIQVRPRGRPPEFDRGQALEQLLLLFWEHGYEHVNQQQMAAATGLSTSSLYNSFGTKPATFREVTRRYLRVVDEVLDGLEHGQRGREDLLDWVERLRARIQSPLGRAGCLITTSMVTVAGHDEEIRALADTTRMRMHAAFTTALARGRALGEPLPDPDATAALLVATMLGLLVTARATHAGPETHHQIDALRTLIQSWH